MGGFLVDRHSRQRPCLRGGYATPKNLKTKELQGRTRHARVLLEKLRGGTGPEDSRIRRRGSVKGGTSATPVTSLRTVTSS